jgi:hypothetical protein
MERGSADVHLNAALNPALTEEASELNVNNNNSNALLLVGRCRLTASNIELKARLVSALETKMR